MTSLPQRVSPLDDESLFGILMRADVENDLPLGSVRLHVATTPEPMKSAVAFASGAGIDFAELAQLTGQPRDALDQLTFMPQLRRLTRIGEPSIRILGPVSLRLCPQCWNSAPMHLRHHLLPGVETCLAHGVVLVRQCSCGGKLSLATRSVGACNSCGTSWSELPADVAPPGVLERDRLLVAAYERLFALERPLRSVSTRNFRRYVTAARRDGASVPAVDMRKTSVYRLAAITVALSSDPDLVAQMLEDGPEPCPNLSCSRYSTDAWSFHDFERHCPVCGSRFIGQRLLSCFDYEHGQSRPTRAQVRRARRRLARWRRALRAACAEFAAANEPITVTAAFRRAQVPMNANLRASRLGLTAIVRSAESRRLDSTGPWRYVLPGCVRQAASGGDIDWLIHWLARDGQSYLPAELIALPQRSAWFDDFDGGEQPGEGRSGSRTR